MKLRTSKVLKILAILLFSLESMAPTVFFSYNRPEEFVKISSFEKLYTTQSLFLSVFTETCDSEGREDATGKQAVLFSNQLTTLSSLTILSKGPSLSHIVAQQARCTSTAPRFKLHCTYNI